MRSCTPRRRRAPRPPIRAIIACAPSSTGASSCWRRRRRRWSRRSGWPPTTPTPPTGGGGVSPLEAVAVAGSGQLHVSGNIGAASREAAQLAWSCLKHRARALQIGARVADHDLHLHFADTEIGKDGGSAGLALFLAAAS